MEELEMSTIDDMLESRIKNLFEEYEKAMPGSEEQEHIHKQLVDLLKLHEEKEKNRDEMYSRELDSMEKKKVDRAQRRGDVILKLLDVGAKVLGTVGTAALAYKMYDFASKDMYMSSGQTSAVKMLNDKVGRI